MPICWFLSTYVFLKPQPAIRWFTGRRRIHVRWQADFRIIPWIISLYNLIADLLSSLTFVPTNDNTTSAEPEECKQDDVLIDPQHND